MTADEYQKLAARTLIDKPEVPFTNEELAIMIAALELGAKVGAVLDYVKKGICHRHGYSQERLKELLESCEDASMTVKVQHLMRVKEQHLSGSDQMMLWIALGLGGECGEVLSDAATLAIDSKELGDVSWYLAGLATLIDVPLSEVFERNIAKLKKRYEAGYSSDASKARVDVT